MKNTIILLLLVLPFSVFSGDFLFNRLEKLYNKDQTKCLEVSKRYIEYFPENPAAYYFSSIIYNARADKSRTTKGKYRNLNRAISYAVSFEEKDDGTVASNVNWDDYTEELKKRAITIVDKLEEEGQKRYSSDLSAKITEFNRKCEPQYVTLADLETTTNIEAEAATETEMEMETAKLVPTGVTVDANSSTKFFGMPNGKEVVISANLEGEQELLRILNKARKEKGMPELEWDEDLAKAARYHAYDLATQDYFDHASFDRNGGKLIQVGGTFDRIKKFYSKSFVNSENIAGGNGSPEATYMQWFNSKGHYENMFNPSSKKVGLGVFYDPNSTYGYYWVFCTAL